MKAKRVAAGVACIMAGVLFAMLSCGPYSFYSREVVRIDIDAGTITHTFEDVRPLYPDSVDKGWEELIDLLYNDPPDTTEGEYRFVTSGALELDKKKHLNVILKYTYLPTEEGKGFSKRWADLPAKAITRIIDNGEEFILAKPSFFVCSGDSCSFASKQKLIETDKNRLLVFPETTRSIEYSFTYDFPRHEATYQKFYNEEREERGWEEEW